MVQLSFLVFIDQSCILLLHLSVVLLQSVHIIDHQTCLSSYSEHFDVLNVFRNVCSEVSLKSVLLLNCFSDLLKLLRDSAEPTRG